jgi:hypothetical protein
MTFAHRAVEMKRRGYEFALAHVEMDAVSPFLDPTHRILMPAGAVMMPMWIRGDGGEFVSAVLGSEPSVDAPEVSIRRTGFLSITRVPWNPA